MINLLWVLAVVVALGFGAVPGLLAILCLFVMDGVLELKAVRAYVAAVAEVFAVEPDMTEERAEAMTAAVMERVKQEVAEQASRRIH